MIRFAVVACVVLTSGCGGSGQAPDADEPELSKPQEKIPAKGPTRVSIRISGKDGVKITGAQLFFFPEEIQPATVGDIARQFSQLRGKMKLANSVDGRSAVFAAVDPGRYSLCIVPISGDTGSTSITQLMAAHPELKVFCQPAEIVYEEPTIDVEAPEQLALQ